MNKLLFCTYLLTSLFSFAEEQKPNDDRFDEAFSLFSAAAKTGEYQVIAKYASQQILDYYKEPFEAVVNNKWRLTKCVLHTAPRVLFREGRVIFVEAVIEVEELKKPRFVVMHWVKVGDDGWVFLDFPFRGAGFLPTHAFDNYSMSEISYALLKSEPNAKVTDHR